MQCISCAEEVSEKFLHAISQNLCPFCGQLIMPEELKVLLNNLAVVMSELEIKSFLGETEAWLKQNFDLISMASDEYGSLIASLDAANERIATISEELATTNKKLEEASKDPLRNFRQTNQQPQTEGSGQLIQVGDPTKTNEFMKRAEVGNLVARTDELKKVAAKIRAAGGKGNTMTVPLYDVVEDDYDPSEAEEDWNEPLDPVAEALASLGGQNNQSGTYNPRDVAKLQQLHAKQRNAIATLEGGGASMGGRTVFSRA
jgi:hypothetical protein